MGKRKRPIRAISGSSIEKVSTLERQLSCNWQKAIWKAHRRRSGAYELIALVPHQSFIRVCATHWICSLHNLCALVLLRTLRHQYAEVEELITAHVAAGPVGFECPWEGGVCSCGNWAIQDFLSIFTSSTAQVSVNSQLEACVNWLRSRCRQLRKGENISDESTQCE